MPDLEFYPTPAWQTRVLLHFEDVRGTVLEPCCGDGAIADLLERTHTTVLRNDLAPRGRAVGLFEDVAPLDVTGHDATSPAFWKAHQDLDWVVTNPPFSRAPELLPLARKAARNVAFLLRISYLEPAENRVTWLQTHPPARLIFMPRASYVVGAKSRTDNVGTMWAIWHRFGMPTCHLTWVADRKPFERPDDVPSYESSKPAIAEEASA